MSAPYWVVAFYKFTELTDIVNLQATLKQFCISHEILGTILIANEGINGTVSGREESIQAVVAFLKANAHFADLDCKYSYADFSPFQKIKIFVKKEIVTLGVPNIKPALKTGTPIAPEAWDQLINDPEVFLIDTRNTYETELGTFKGALDPKTENFRDFPNFVKENLDPKKHKKIAMFCTGGIRCEKASSYLLEQGFENVYQLQGGILKYLERTDSEKSSWQGECFIFDDRIVLEKEFIIAKS